MEDDSDDPSNFGSFKVPSQTEETSISLDHPEVFKSDEVPIATIYEIIQDGSQKGRNKLADSNGYSYTVLVHKLSKISNKLTNVCTQRITKW